MRGMTERDKKLRLLYGAAFLVLMVVETLIALYVHDKVIRPYVGAENSKKNMRTEGIEAGRTGSGGKNRYKRGNKK